MKTPAEIAEQVQSTPLTLSITREVTPREIAGLVLGTGAGSYPWWHRLEVHRFVIVRHELVADAIENIQDGDIVLVSVDDPEDDGERIIRTFTLQQIVDAVAEVWHELPEQAQREMAEDLGLADAEAADMVLQTAVFKELVYS